MAALFEFLGEITAEVLSAFATRNRGWSGVVIVGLVAIVVAVIVWITVG
jgi:hypothetical protein